MKRILFSIIALTVIVPLSVQAQFLNTVKIEFEKSISVKAMYKELDPEWYDIIKDQLPQTDIAYYDFIGDSTHSIYQPGREVQNNYRMYRPIADKNVVYTNYTT